jgi:hypothetical protein
MPLITANSVGNAVGIDRPADQNIRVVRTPRGAEVLQYFDGRSFVQLELTGRPDGVRPGGFETMLAMLRQRLPVPGLPRRRITPQEWMELDREAVQYQRRRRTLQLAAADAQNAGDLDQAARFYTHGAQDAQHVLDILDFAAVEHPTGRLLSADPQTRPTVVAQQCLAEARLSLLCGNVEGALARLAEGQTRVVDCLRLAGIPDPDHNAALRELTDLQAGIRSTSLPGGTAGPDRPGVIRVGEPDFVLTAREQTREPS